MGLELKTTKRTCSEEMELELKTAKGIYIDGILKLKTAKGIYINDMTKGIFAVDCSCSDSYKNFESKINGSKYTDGVEECEFLSILELEYKEKNGQKPLVITCVDCGKKIRFTHESYYKLQRRMVRIR